MTELDRVDDIPCPFCIFRLFKYTNMVYNVKIGITEEVLLESGGKIL